MKPSKGRLRLVSFLPPPSEVSFISFLPCSPGRYTPKDLGCGFWGSGEVLCERMKGWEGWGTSLSIPCEVKKKAASVFCWCHLVEFSSLDDAQSLRCYATSHSIICTSTHTGSWFCCSSLVLKHTRLPVHVMCTCIVHDTCMGIYMYNSAWCYNFWTT